MNERQDVGRMEKKDLSFPQPQRAPHCSLRFCGYPRKAIQKGMPERTAINQERERLRQTIFAKQTNRKRKEVWNRQSGAGAVHPVGDAREAQPEHGRVGNGRATRNREAMKGESLIEEVLTVLMLVALWLMWLMVPA